MIAVIPELGTLPGTKAAALAGLAPMNRDSGQYRGKRKIQGGRPAIRQALYMAALVARAHNPVIMEFYQRLRLAGKPAKVALTACMRKILVILNAMLKNRTYWNPQLPLALRRVREVFGGTGLYCRCEDFDIPYRIESGRYYHVAGVPQGKEGKPTIMWLKDYNGDGQAWEFALFDAIACMGLPTTLIGYSEAQDRVIQYPVTLTVIAGNQKSTRTALWVDYLFSQRPERPGVLEIFH